MAESIIDVYIKLIQILVIISILILIIYRRKTMKMRVLDWFIYIFLFALLQGIMELIIYYYKIEVLKLDNPSHFIYNEFHSIPYSIAVLIIFFLSESIQSLHYNKYRFGVAIFLWSGYLTNLIVETIHASSLEFNDYANSNISNLFFDLFQFFVMLNFTYVLYKANHLSENKRHIKSTKMMYYSSLIYVISILWELGEDLFNFPQFYGAISIGISFLLLMIMFINNPYYTFSVPTRVYKLIITSNIRHSLIYEADISSKSEIPISSELLASSISSISDIMVKSVGSNSTINYFEFGDRAILISRGQLISGLLVSDKPSIILRSALKQMVREFEIQFVKHMNSFNADISQFESSKYLIARNFPFIESTEMINLRIEKPE